MTRRHLVLTLLVLSGSASPHAQAPPDVIAFGSPMNIDFMSGPIAFDTEPVTGAPYSAEAVTDIVQTLADGNRIVRTSKAQISRDSQGRTRREQGLARMEALLDACRKRARPIVMTTIAMGAGMMPIALGLGVDPSFRSPMAIVVIGGLITSTFLSLLVVPVVFTYVDDVAQTINGWLHRRRRAQGPATVSESTAPH